MTNEEKKDMVDLYIKAYNNFDVEKMTENLSDDVTFKNTENGIITLVTNGIEEFKDVAQKAKYFFEDREQQIIEYDYGDNFIMVYIKFEATFAEDVNDKLKKGDTFSVGGKSIFTFENRKIKSIEDYS